MHVNMKHSGFSLHTLYIHYTYTLVEQNGISASYVYTCAHVDKLPAIKTHVQLACWDEHNTWHVYVWKVSSDKQYIRVLYIPAIEIVLASNCAPVCTVHCMYAYMYLYVYALYIVSVLTCPIPLRVLMLMK